jgi:2,3-dihydroxybenzoate decarboxylase
VVPKIALEEHFVPAGLEQMVGGGGFGWTDAAWDDIKARLVDLDGQRIDEMDRLGIEVAVLSLTSPGIQDVVDPDAAQEVAQRSNDGLAEAIARRPDRFAAFAALPMQDPEAAAAELRRAVQELGFKGALVNGYSSLGDLNTAMYYDDPCYAPFWEELERLDVPLYLHPRLPLPDQRRAYEGRPELLGPPWAFAAETAVHALRLISGGVFDRYPKATVILGHLGELMPFAIRRAEQRLAAVPSALLLKPASYYMRENFYLTTSGNCHTPSVVGILLEFGADRLMFACDYPYEQMDVGAEWLDRVEISDADRQKIAAGNARRLLRLGDNQGGRAIGESEYVTAVER